MILQSLAGLPAFLVYFCTALVAVTAYLFVYTRVTPHNEFQLIRDNDPAAAIALGLSLVGFVLPVVSAIAHSANVVDCLIWSLIALIVQIIVYFIVKIPVPNLSARIAAGELAAAIWLGVLDGRGRAQRRLHDLLTMEGKSQRNSASANRTCRLSRRGRRRRRNVPAMSRCS
jgi:putative membrane protein